MDRKRLRHLLGELQKGSLSIEEVMDQMRALPDQPSGNHLEIETNINDYGDSGSEEAAKRAASFVHIGEWRWISVSFSEIVAVMTLNAPKIGNYIIFSY